MDFSVLAFHALVNRVFDVLAPIAKVALVVPAWMRRNIRDVVARFSRRTAPNAYVRAHADCDLFARLIVLYRRSGTGLPNVAAIS